MKTFTGWEYLLIDAANNHYSPLDKQTFEERLEWANNNLAALEAEAEGRSWKKRPLYIKAVQAIRTAQAGEPTGHLVGFDAAASGMQIMAVLTGCEAGGKATGLVDPDKRADAYTDCTEIMAQLLGYHIPNERERVKKAVMTSLYGSVEKPKELFGEGTPELNAFYKAMGILCPGPSALLSHLVLSWQPYAEFHQWQLPDGFTAYIKTMVKKTARIEVDELDHSTFTYTWSENQGVRSDVKNAANMVHSVDAYVMRSLVRRCSYDPEMVAQALDNIQDTLLTRACSGAIFQYPATEKLIYYKELYENSTVADVVILPHLTWHNCQQLSTAHLKALQTILQGMAEHPPFDIITIHDDFKCHPNHMNQLRKHYRELLAELADSSVLNWLLSQLYGRQVSFNKWNPDLGQYIRKSNYALS